MAIGQLFVYGSLMKDFFNYNKYLDGKVLKIEDAYIVGSLYHIENKGFPGYIPSGHDPVYGQIITISDYDAVLKAVDHMEGYKGVYSFTNMYNRKPIEVRSLDDQQAYTLQVYVYNMEAECNRDDQRIYIEHGSWRRYMKEV